MDENKDENDVSEGKVSDDSASEDNVSEENVSNDNTSEENISDEKVSSDQAADFISPGDENKSDKDDASREGDKPKLELAKEIFDNFLHLRGIENLVPAEWVAKLPEERRKITIPILALLATLFLTTFLAIFSPGASKKSAEQKLPLVQVEAVKHETVNIPVFSRGIVIPSHEIQLVSIVKGPVVEVSPSMIEGGVVKKGELLVKVSSRSYEQDKEKVEAQLARAEASQIAKQGELRVRGTLRTSTGKAQLKEVNFAVKAARADLQRAEDLIVHTEIRAPFDGLIRNAGIKVGQIISAGFTVGSIFSTSRAEVHLPMSDRQLGLIDVPFYFDSGADKSANDISAAIYSNNEDKTAEEGGDKGMDTDEPPVQPKPMAVSKSVPVKLVGSLGDSEFSWQGEIARSASGRNEINHLQYLIAEIKDPFAADPQQPERPPLSPGFFVQAEIQGKTFENVAVLPRRALRPNQRVWVVGEENKLVSRQTEVLYRGKDKVFVSAGLKENERVVVSDIRVFLEGLKVKVIDDKQAAAPEAGTEK